MVPFSLLPEKPHAPDSSQHESHFQPDSDSQFTKQERCGVPHYMLSVFYSAARSWLTLSANCSPPAQPPALSSHGSATRSLTQFDFHGIHLNSREAGISLSYKGCFKKFSRFYHFSHSLQFSFLAFEKRHTAVLWITAVNSGSR